MANQSITVEVAVPDGWLLVDYRYPAFDDHYITRNGIVDVYRYNSEIEERRFFIVIPHPLIA